MNMTAARTFLIIATTLTVSHRAFGQEPPAYDARAGVRLMRAINTAENAQRRSGGYLPLNQLLTLPQMVGVAANVTLDGNDAIYLGQNVRLMVSADRQKYQVAIVPASTCGAAVFTDEGGLIYTGKVLDCP